MPDELIVIGSASAVPTQHRFPSAYALNVTGKLFLLDCGAPVSTLLYHYNLDPMDVRAVFLSHWHMDHVANLGLLISQNHLCHRSEKLRIYGPRGTRGKIRRLLADSFLQRESLSYKLKVTNIKTGKKYKEALLRVTFFKTQHLDRPKLKTQFGRKAQACGMIVDGPGWRVLYSGDIGSPKELAPYIKDCDLLIHEMAHHRPEAVAEFAEAAKIPHVLISHIGPEFDETPDAIFSPFARHYSGNLIVAEDGTKVRLSHIRDTGRIEVTTPTIQWKERRLAQAPIEVLPGQTSDKNPAAAFVQTLQQEFGFSQATARQVLQVAQDILGSQTVPGRQPGQVGVVVASLQAPFGAPLTETDKVEVNLTIDTGAEDAQVEAKEGVTGLRRGRILRLLEEAIEQEGVLTQEDLAWILNVNVRTIRRDIQALKEEGHSIYTRGQLKDQEEIQLYKARLIKWWLDGTGAEQIAPRIHQAPQAVQRYIDLFLKINTLYQQGQTAQEITAQLNASPRLAQRYLELIEQIPKKPKWQAKLRPENGNEESDG